MAESLVNITSFKRKSSMVPEKLSAAQLMLLLYQKGMDLYGSKENIISDQNTTHISSKIIIENNLEDRMSEGKKSKWNTNSIHKNDKSVPPLTPKADEDRQEITRDSFLDALKQVNRQVSPQAVSSQRTQEK